MEKVALITGANRGIGFETARQLAQKGLTVLLGAREASRGEEAAAKLRQSDLNVQFLQIDPVDPKSVASAVKAVTEKYGRLDILINNAGTLVQEDYAPPSEVPTSAFRKTFEINVFGLHEVTSQFWPLLNKSAGARLVNVSSMLGSLTAHSDGTFADFKVIAYDSSKAAVNMMTTHYAHQWKNTPHRANCIHPGSVKTDLNPNGELSVEEGARTSVDLALIADNGPNGGFFYMGKTLPW